MSDYLTEFLNAHPPVEYSAPRKFKGEVCAVKLELGWKAFVTGAPFFPIVPGLPMFTEEAQKKKCYEAIALAGSESEPRLYVQLTTYPPYLNKPTREKEASMGMTIADRFRGDELTDYGTFSSQFIDEDGALFGMLNKRVWAHIFYHPYPSYKKDDSSTWGNWNTQKNSQTGETEPRWMTRAVRSFFSEEEARNWYNEQDKGDSPAMSSSSETMTWDKAIEQMSVPTNWNKSFGNWSEMDDSLWPETALGMIREMMGVDTGKKISPDDYHKSFSAMIGGSDHPIDIGVLTQLHEVGEKYLPF